MTTPGRASSQRHFRVRAAINGVDLGVFDRRSGGGTSANNPKHTPGSAPSSRVALGGARETEDVTVSRDFVATRDHDLIRQFRPLCGLAEMTVSQVPLDKDGREFGRPDIWTGVLASISTPEYDGAADAGMATFEIVMTADGDPA